MDLERLDPADDAELRAIYAFTDTLRRHDEPWEPPWVFRAYAGMLRSGWDGAPARQWVLREGGEIVAVLSLDTPERDNRHAASIDIRVRPDRRLRGLGRAMAARAHAMVRAAGRRTVFAETLDAPGPSAFAEGLGYARAGAEFERRLDFRTVDWQRIEALRHEAARHAGAYDLIRFDGPVPDDLLDAVARMTAAIDDAPSGALDVERGGYDAERVRALENSISAWGRRWYRLAARHRDGELAGQTIVAVDPDDPADSSQYDTSVVREHRGHRLGMLLKTSMMLWLRDREPGLRTLETANDEDNAPMIAINDALGYQIVARRVSWQRTV